MISLYQPIKVCEHLNLTIFIIFASLKDLKASLVHRVMQETEAVHLLNDCALHCCVRAW